MQRMQIPRYQDVSEPRWRRGCRYKIALKGEEVKSVWGDLDKAGEFSGLGQTRKVSAISQGDLFCGDRPTSTSGDRRQSGVVCSGMVMRLEVRR